MSKLHIPRRRPSAAMLVACCALFVALGGTSYAVAVGSIGSLQVRDDSIRSIDVHNRSLRGHDLAPDSVGGGAIKERSLDTSRLDVSRLPAVPLARAVEGAGAPPAQVLVLSDGRSEDARGVTRVEHLRTGVYNVVFDRPVSRCVLAATLSYRGAIGDPDRAGAGEITARPNGDDARFALVRTADSSDRLRDNDFYLLASC